MKSPFQNFSKRLGLPVVFERGEDIYPVEVHGRCHQENQGGPFVMEKTEPDSNIENYVEDREKFHDDIEHDSSSDINEMNFVGA